MAGYWGGAWTSLKYSIGRSTMDVLGHAGYRYLKHADGTVVYKNNRAYKSVGVFSLVQMGAQAAKAELQKLFPRYQKYLQDKLLEKVRERQKENLQTVIAAGQKVDTGLGYITLPEGYEIYAKDRYGNTITDSLFLYYESNSSIAVQNYSAQANGTVKESHPDNIATKTIFFYDLTPHVSQSTSKNVVLTKVQGRDYSRKELIGSGDIVFSVTGSVNSGYDGVYPENDVKKLIQILQHNGVIKVNHQLFRQFNVSQVIVQDFKLGEQTFKNIQPYSFTCVAVEPDDDVVVSKDTISVLNAEIQADPVNAWYKLVLGQKLEQLQTVGMGDINERIGDLVKNII